MNWQPGQTLESIEREVIEHAYKFYGHNKTKTASALGIAIRTLDAKLDRYAGREASDGKAGTEIGNGAFARLPVESNAQAGKEQPMHLRKRQEIQKVSSK